MINENLRVGRGGAGGDLVGYKRILFHTYKGSHMEEGFRVSERTLMEVEELEYGRDTDST